MSSTQYAGPVVPELMEELRSPPRPECSTPEPEGACAALQPERIHVDELEIF